MYVGLILLQANTAKSWSKNCECVIDIACTDNNMKITNFGVTTIVKNNNRCHMIHKNSNSQWKLPMIQTSTHQQITIWTTKFFFGDSKKPRVTCDTNKGSSSITISFIRQPRSPMKVSFADTTTSSKFCTALSTWVYHLAACHTIFSLNRDPVKGRRSHWKSTLRL